MLGYSRLWEGLLTFPCLLLDEKTSVEAEIHLSLASVALSRRRGRYFPRTQSTVSILHLVIQSTVSTPSRSLELQRVRAVGCATSTVDFSHYPLPSRSLTVDCIKLQSAVNPCSSIIVDCLSHTVDYLSCPHFY